LHKLFDAGAVPVRAGAPEEVEWVGLPYEDEDRFIEAVIEEWVRGDKRPTVGDMWFSLPE
jgi:hypothetical protein